MSKKRVFISSRIKEMRDFREAAVRAIESAGMEAIHFSTIDSQNFLKSDLEHITELLDGVKSCDIFLGLYGQTLDSFTPKGYAKHSMELEQETAESIGLRCFYYVEPLTVQCDHDMTRFRQQIMQKGAEFLTTPDELYRGLFAQLGQL